MINNLDMIRNYSRCSNCNLTIDKMNDWYKIVTDSDIDSRKIRVRSGRLTVTCSIDYDINSFNTLIVYYNRIYEANELINIIVSDALDIVKMAKMLNFNNSIRLLVSKSINAGTDIEIASIIKLKDKL